MSDYIQLPLPNFSRDMRIASIAVATAAGILALGTLAVAGTFFYESRSMQESRSRLELQTSEINVQLATLRQRGRNEPKADAIGSLRQRIAKLNALDSGFAPAVTRVLSVLEEIMPPSVALQNFDYDRSKGALEVVAVSASSEDLTVFYGIASQTPFFKNVHLIDKKQAGTAETGELMYEVRLSVHLKKEPQA
jgi:hypothetical protein